MQVRRIAGLPEGALAAAAAFHAEWLDLLIGLKESPPLGEVAARSDGGGGAPPLSPSDPPVGGPPPPKGEDLVLIFPAADHTHHAWRLAAVQSLARELAPRRVNALASADEAAISAGLAYLESAAGLTGQYLPLDNAGAGLVISSPA